MCVCLSVCAFLSSDFSSGVAVALLRPTLPSIRPILPLLHPPSLTLFLLPFRSPSVVSPVALPLSMLPTLTPLFTFCISILRKGPPILSLFSFSLFLSMSICRLSVYLSRSPCVCLSFSVSLSSLFCLCVSVCLSLCLFFLASISFYEEISATC